MTSHSEPPARDDLAPEREAALREILQVISRSRDDEQPVFDAILESASRLCEAAMAAVVLGHEGGNNQVLVAQHGVTEATGELYRSGAYPMNPKVSIAAEAIIERRTIHVEDMAETAAYREGDPRFRALVHEQGIRTNLFVPLVSRGEGIGCLILQRREVRPYSPEQIALVEAFASQAVIAIENVRQFRELQTRLEREAASREILGVISRSRDDEGPVFDTILANSARLCDAPMARLHLADPERRHFHLAAAWGDKLRSIQPGDRYPLDGTLIVAQTILEARTIHLTDLAASQLYLDRNPVAVRLVEEEGIRTRVTVPLVSGSAAIGCITLSRREVKPFTGDQIALVETFAAQAVIAIENVRQFRELQTRLEREAATREILEVISRSRDDDQPVFEVLLEKAAALCNAANAGLEIVNEERTHLVIAANLHPQPSFTPGVDSYPLDAEMGSTRSVRECRIFHSEDLAERLAESGDDDLTSETIRRLMADGVRTVLWVPLVRAGVAIGTFGLFRHEVRPFSDDEIALVETFAAQAVIAIENVRQFRELQTRLEREAATREILQVISTSRDDEQPVFQAIHENASRLCDAPFSGLFLVDEAGDHLELVSHFGGNAQYVESTQRRWPLSDVSAPARAVVKQDVVHIPDLRDTDAYRSGHEPTTRVVDEEGARTFLAVPLTKGGVAVGSIGVYRREARPFSRDQIELLKTFAAQAVIAIENVRQFRELQTRLEREAATRQILQVIAENRADEKPVFDAILENATRLCNAPLAYLSMANEERTHVTVPAHRGARPDFAADLDDLRVPMESSKLVLVRAITERKVIRMDDIADDELYRNREPNRVAMVEREGARSIVAVPLISDGRGIGAIILYRREVAPFSDDDVVLAESFAAQAAIAVENVRQFRAIQTANVELQARLEREQGTAEILQVLSQSREDEAPVFDLILQTAAELCGAQAAALTLGKKGDAHQRLAASRGMHPATKAHYDAGHVSMSPKSLAARAILSGAPVHVEDFAETEGYRQGDGPMRSLVDDTGMRTSLFVPLVTKAGGIGALVLFRKEVRPYKADEISLVETFAAQAVIAIENVEQFRALETLNASLESRVEAQVGEIERMGRLKRFLSPAVADAVVSSGNDKLLSSHRALIAVLFCDIRGFTAFCERAEPEETIEVLQTYHEEMGRLIRDHGGGVDTRAGDGIMVIFNDPLPCDDPAGDALRLALAMRAQMAGLCQRWRRLGHRLGFGVGISLGYATVGMVGSEGRYDYTASGTAVNLAARLCDEADDGEILLSPRAYAAVEPDFPAESLGERSFKGIHAPVEVFRVTADRPAP